jgi:NAD(P)-dependent dehydrogenase (short-subunit alcohol dehydrogenase family)
MDLHLRGKRVLITGASKGIGAAAAEAFAEEGCHLRLAARSGDQLKALAERLRSAHQIDATAHVVDLRKPEDLARLAKDASDIDILVNNAGDIPGGSIDKIDEATWRYAWDLKVFGYINLTRSIFHAMKQRRDGVIVNIIGYAGERLFARYIIGSTGNAALMAFSRSVGSQSPDFGVRVVAVNPGYTATDRAESVLRKIAQSKFGSAERWRDVERELDLPFGRMGKPGEVADVVTFLVSPRASYVSGTVVTVDGGAANRNG